MGPDIDHIGRCRRVHGPIA